MVISWPRTVEGITTPDRERCISRWSACGKRSEKLILAAAERVFQCDGPTISVNNGLELTMDGASRMWLVGDAADG
jgi:hypothetical protein